ncbi:major intrinsic protein, Aquaporin-like protein [Artemisia annua]|uniref:Major intrinsic protein, Aquaporin-like protein n=1 Tax=Artemisia annua TaxID=35608 RepID=A0A2U1QJU9_ARTAN|nr:major intrinsic protein, Aquaporin-like protein [Artemisia annua]
MSSVKVVYKEAGLECPVLLDTSSCLITWGVGGASVTCIWANLGLPYQLWRSGGGLQKGPCDWSNRNGGIAIVWGLVVMVMIYTVGHISGAHFNPAVTIAFATSKRFPFKNVPPYIITQILGSILASGTLRLIFNGRNNNLGATVPTGSDLQSLVLEFIITFYLMFVISSVATDDRAIGKAAGLAIGSTILLNAMFAGPISGASMNPARTLGPAIVSNQYRGLWVYILGPTVGAIAGAWAHNIIRFTDKPLAEIVKNSSILQRKTVHSV